MSKFKGMEMIIGLEGAVTLGCPCSMAGGGCTQPCHIVSIGDAIPCSDCPASSVVFMAIAMSEAARSNPFILANMIEPVVLSII